MPTYRDRYYSAPPATQNIAIQYVWDSTATITGNTPPTTGCYRPFLTSDYNVTIASSGVSVTVGAVAITGTPPVQVSNFPQSYGITGTVNSTGNLGVSGALELIGSVGITGNINIANKIYTTYLSGITSGSVLIPTGTLSWSVAVESGSAYINNLLLNEGSSFNGGGYGSYFSNSTLNIGCTGGRTLIMWEV